MKFLGALLIIALCFIVNVFITAPIIIKIYNLMLYDITQVAINIKFVIGFLILKSVVAYKYDSESSKKEFSDQMIDSATGLVMFVIFVCLSLGFAHLYTWFIG